MFLNKTSRFNGIYKTIYFHFVLVIVLYSKSFAQMPEWNTYSKESSINSIITDDDTIWAGTNSGLLKLDKTTGISIFYNKSNSGLCDNNITSLASDYNGNKWIGTKDNGLVIFNGISWSNYNMANSELPDNKITAVIIDNSGIKWIGTHSGLVKLDGENWTVYDSLNSPILGNHINTISIDGLNNKWIGTPDGLIKYDDENWTIYNEYNSGLPENNITSIAFNDSVGTQDKSFYPSFSIPDYQLIWQDEFEENTLNPAKWEIMRSKRRSAQNSEETISISNGIFHIQTFTKDSIHYTGFIRTKDLFETCFGFFEARIRFDSSPGEWGGLWLITDTVDDPVGDPAETGAEIDIVEYRAIDINDKDITDNYVANLHWHGYGAEHQTVGSGLIKAKTDGSSIQGEWHTFGVLWTPDNYTFTFDGNPKWITSTAVSKVPEHILLTCEVDDKSWAGSIPSGGYGPIEESKTYMHVDWVRVWQLPDNHENNTNIEKCLNLSENILSNNSNSFFSYNQQNPDIKWIGTASSGLTKRNSKNWEVYNSSTEMPFNSVFSIAIDSTGIKWLGTEKGLIKYDGKEWIILDTSNSGLMSNKIKTIFIDSFNNKWLGTDSGLTVYNEGGYISNIQEKTNLLITDFFLSQNYPNPFNPTTIIKYTIPESPLSRGVSEGRGVFVILKVYNLLGQEAATLVKQQQPAGNYEVKFDASNLASGVYLYKLQAGDFTLVKKLMLLK